MQCAHPCGNCIDGPPFACNSVFCDNQTAELGFLPDVMGGGGFMVVFGICVSNLSAKQFLSLLMSRRRENQESQRR